MNYAVSIPQAVGTIAIRKYSKYQFFLDCFCVSIPQAVGTIAIYTLHIVRGGETLVSIPQAVGTIAIRKCKVLCRTNGKFQYRKR